MRERPTNRNGIAALAELAPYNQDSDTIHGQRAIAGSRHRVRRAAYVAPLRATRSKSRLTHK